jgi:phospholipase C
VDPVTDGRRFFHYAVCFAVLCLLTHCGGLPQTGKTVTNDAARRTSQGQISHVVIIVQENRSFENFFAGYPHANAPMYGCGHLRTGAAATSLAQETSNSGCPYGDDTIPLHQITFQSEPNPEHEFQSAIVDWHNGHMDGFTHWGATPKRKTAAYAYIERSQVATYWDMAQNYVLADEMFPTEFGPSWTAHLTLVAGTDSLSDRSALANFPDGKSNCRAEKGTKTTTVDTNRKIHNDTGPYPCLDQFTTMAQLLDTAGVSWKYYANTRLKAFIWSPFAAIKYVYHGADWTNNIITPQTQILKDIAKNRLPAVSWVTPAKVDSDHPAARSDTGPSWVASIVNAIGASSYWNTTAIVVVWDDWGGFYDNGPPPQLDYRGLGIRVPCLIVSPYAKAGHVVHTAFEFGSILKFIEEMFGLPPLGPASAGYTDTRANSISTAFDFRRPPRPFVHISAKYPASYFEHERPSDEPIDSE